MKIKKLFLKVETTGKVLKAIKSKNCEVKNRISKKWRMKIKVTTCKK